MDQKESDHQGANKKEVNELAKYGFREKEFIDYADTEDYLKIAKEEEGVNKEINKLESTVKAVLNNQYREYIEAFNKFMENNRKDMTKEIDFLQNKI